MITHYFAVYDKKTESYGQLFPAQTFGAAERMFEQSVKDSNSMASKYPSDFALYACFSFDDDSGTVVDSFAPPRLVVEASSLVS